MLYCIVFGGIFILTGGLFYTGKALRWVRGWQMMPEEERAKVRIRPLCRNLSAAFFLAGLLFLAGGVFPAFRETGLRWGLIAWMVLCWLDLLYIDRSGAYRVPAPGRR